MELSVAATMARELLAEHGLDDWGLGFDRARRRAGCCRFGYKVISLSMPLTAIHPDDDVRETVLHEIAHALVGPGHGHDEAWRAQAVAIGSKGERCLADDVPTLPGRFTGTCPQGHQVARHKRATRVTSCSTCSHSFDHRSLLTWAIGDVSIRMLPTYVADLVRIVDSTGSSIAQEQLDLDAALGGGRGHRSVAALGQRLAPGTRVRLRAEAGKYAGQEGVVLGWSRTKYKIRCDGSTLQVPPALLAVHDAT